MWRPGWSRSGKARVRLFHIGGEKGGRYGRQMRQLGKIEVLKSAGIATLLTGGAIYPRLSIWEKLEGQVFANLLVLMWCVFVMWAFVFAWHKEYSGRDALRFDLSGKDWASVAAAGLLAALLLRFLADERLREIAPWNYPATGMEWLAVALFGTFFGSLFLVLAPFAFFIRLSRSKAAAAGLTVVSASAVMGLRFAAASGAGPATWLFAALGGCQAALVLALHLRFGAFGVWAFIALIEARHLPDVM